jgi:thioredoxin-related protein
LKKTAFFFTLVLTSLFAFSQNDNVQEKPIYLRFPTIPEFTVYKAPDSTAFSRNNLHKKMNTIFMIFSPDCEYCQRETKMLLQEIKKFKHTQFIMITYLPYHEMLRFYHNYKIEDYPQITMARDTRFFFPVFFKVRNLPSLFVYDKKGNFKKSFEGDVKPDSVLAEL